MILFRPEAVEPILEGRKTQTRRIGRRRWRVGAIHQAATRLFDRDAVFAELLILRVWRHSILNTSPEEAAAEGYGSREEFLEAFFDINPTTYPGQDRRVWAVEFKVVARR